MTMPALAHVATSLIAALVVSGVIVLLAYAIGTMVTVLMSNEATAVVLMPALYAAVRKAGAKPLPFLFVCEFIVMSRVSCCRFPIPRTW